MIQTPLDYQIVTETIESMHLGDFSGATIRDIASLAGTLEKKTGQPFIHLEMGVPGLKPSQIGMDAEKKALDEGCAAIYPPNAGIAPLKNAASRFIKAFIGIDLKPEGCIATVGSMQGTFAVFTTLHLAMPERDSILFIHPGFPVQTDQCKVIGLKPIGLDIHDYRGPKLIEKLDEILAQGNIAGIVYSNPNNPTWVCFTDDELKGIGELATKHDVIVLEDLAYFAMDFRRDLSHPFEAPYQATVARYTDNYVMTISASKAFSYAGQRIGVCCISDGLYHRKYQALQDLMGVAEFGRFLDARVIYTLSSGCCHSVQYGMAAMMDAACDGRFDFVNQVKEYGRRAAFLKKVLLSNGFYLVYDNDMGEPLADGFYFTVQYPGMTDLQLTRELMYYGIAVYPLDTMGSHEQGVRVCTSFFKPEQEPIFAERIEAFRANHV
ncbi:MAG: pyridoxal phosphate-dependent aminotransferase [Bacteroidales bacterium]|nr:pyridoxal phosphate-dependent aminotransferase [Bacteroidales bacterium]